MRTQLFAAVAAASLLFANAAPAAGALKTAIFAGGCFWSAEHDIEHTKGVTDVVVGYAGGTTKNPNYDHHDGFLESIKVTYDPSVISYAQLVDAFFHHIDPTDPSGQFCDQGPSYRTAVFTADPQEKAEAELIKSQVGQQLRMPIKTMILGPTTFWMGESYHQHYAEKNPGNYMAYRIGCGRDRSLKAVWAKPPGGNERGR
ncbi:peptide-methionine (S)-S-oxide reductase MsrA [Phenylobacterium sp.]|uniref:peptide-methionine (S)-S-oxide reductase MsrA n=1 Tax=Phenylobacterium sp. TaxID=1871053 RepID=UPI002F42653F